MRFVLPFALVVGLALGALGCSRGEPAPATAAPAAKAAPADKVPQYYCPMDKEVTSDKPGTCPKCGMNLELKK
ncbi:MAG: hypothetical protein HY906_24190 [Deltaproteobacteria bacterium]|nr:hypothetical protein [Deltaproteobacteria bacterium]